MLTATCPVGSASQHWHSSAVDPHFSMRPLLLLFACLPLLVLAAIPGKLKLNDWTATNYGTVSLDQIQKIMQEVRKRNYEVSGRPPPYRCL